MRQHAGGATPFLPSLRQGVWLAVLTLSAIGCAAYLRFVVDQSPIRIACEGEVFSLLCAGHKAMVEGSTRSAFGLVALVAAVVNLLWPSILWCAVALSAASFGLMLYNAGTSSLSIALLILALARCKTCTSPAKVRQDSGARGI
jgi:hypothetical protein